MKVVKVTCDGCQKRITPTMRREGGGRLSMRLYIHGYGLQDGLHDLKADVCSAKCGLELLEERIAEIRSSR